MTVTEAKVTSELQRRVTFFLPIRSEHYRQVPDTRIWRAESKFGPDEDSGDFQFPEDIADNVIEQLFGFQKGGSFERDSGLLESCTGSGDLAVTVDMDLCRYSRISLERAFQVLTEMLNSGEDFYANDPYRVNRGTQARPDFEKRYDDFDVPDQVRRALRRRKITSK